MTQHDACSGKQGDLRKQRLFQLMQKHTLLTAISLIFCTSCWLIFDFFGGISQTNGLNQDFLFILSIDPLVKSLCVVLMFKFYEDIFTKMCCCCLHCLQCNGVKQLFPYFDTDETKKDQTIYAQCQKAVAMDDIYGEDMSVNESVINQMEQTPIKHSADIWNDGAVVAYNKPLPNKPSMMKLQVFQQNSVGSQSRDSPQSYSKELPVPSFDVKPYKMYNFIACLTDPSSGKQRYLNYASKGYNIIPTIVFGEIDEQSKLHGIVSVNDVQFGRDNKFSFLQKLKTKCAYTLAIRMEDHSEHIDDAKKLLKYAEYKLNEQFNSMQRSGGITDLEQCFDGIAKELLGRGVTGFTTFDHSGARDGFAVLPK